MKRFVNVAWRRQTDPVGAKGDMHSQVSITGFLDSQFVVIGAKCSNKMVSVRLRAVSHAKIVDNQAESDIESLVLKESVLTLAGTTRYYVVPV